MTSSAAVDSATPVYLRIAARIRAAIGQSEYPVGDRLPSEPEFAKHLGVARGTLRKAIDLLVQEGLLRRVQGKGTFVTPRPIDSAMVTSLSSVAEELNRQGVEFVTTVHRSRIIPIKDAPGAEPLRPHGAERVLEIHRSRADAVGPIAYFENFVGIDDEVEAEFFRDADFERQPLFAVVKQVKGAEIVGGQRTMSAVAASPTIAGLLKVGVGSPLIYIEQVSFAASDDPIECSNIWIVPNRMQISTFVPRYG